MLTENQISTGAVKVLAIWENKITKRQIRVLNITNKIVVAELIPHQTLMFLTTIDLEQNYQMVNLQTHSKR